MDRPALLSRLAERIAAIERPHPTRVAVEGRSAAGKSAFADALGDALAPHGRQVIRAGIDDFHPPNHSERSRSRGYTPATLYEEGYDYAAFERLLLAPMGPGGGRRLTVGLFDSAKGRAIEDAAVDAAPDAIVVVDGAFLLRPELRRHWDLAIWLDVSFETVLARAMKRDVAWVGDPERVRANYRAGWIPTHELYEATGAMDAADVVINHEDFAAPRVIRGL